MIKIAVIAGEDSGDLLGAHLMRYLKQHSACQFIGVGGDAMAQEGLESFFPFDELSKFGLIEVLPYYAHIKKRVKQLSTYIKANQVDIFISIDSPYFTKQVAKQLKNSNIILCHWVAPSVWAWRKKRRFSYANIFDYLFCLLPFEPPYFDDTSLQPIFSGHPIADIALDSIDISPIMVHKSHNNARILTLLPGSRLQEIHNHYPTMLQTALQAKALNIIDDIMVLTTPRTCNIIQRITANYHNVAIIDQPYKYALLKASSYALAASGTVTLECALAQLPTVICYKVNPITSFLLRHLLYTKYVGLINILANNMVMPELLQQNMTADNMIDALQMFHSHANLDGYKQDLYKYAMRAKAPNGEDAASIVGNHIIALSNKE